MKKIGIFATFTVLLLLCGISFGQEQATSPDYSWLNGKWQGPDRLGGMLVMDLRVVNGNQVKGSGRLPGGGRNIGVSTVITGTVDGTKVNLDSLGQSNHITIKYVLTFADGTLTGKSFDPRASSEGFETTFRKLD